MLCISKLMQLKGSRVLARIYRGVFASARKVPKNPNYKFNGNLEVLGTLVFEHYLCTAWTCYKDPFAPTTSGKVISQQPRRSVNSGFPEVSFPPPTSKIHQKSASLQQQENAKPVFTAAAAVPNTSESNFANFEVANFRAPSEDQKGECTKIL